MSDKRLYTVQALQKFFDERPQDETYILELRYNNKDSARGLLPGQKTTPQVIQQFVELNERMNESETTRIHIYKEKDPRHALISISRELLYKLIQGIPGYDPNAPRRTYEIGELENRSTRLQILMRPSIKKELKRLADLHGTTMSNIIDELVSTWINKIQSE